MSDPVDALKAEGNAKVLVCPYHAWAYNLDGSLRSARHMPEGFDRQSYGLKEIALKEVEGLVLISFAEQPIGLDDGEAAAKEEKGRQQRAYRHIAGAGGAGRI